LAIIKAGFSKKLRYIKKTHGIFISWLNEVCFGPTKQMDSVYVPSGRNASDLGTKALPGATHDRLTRFCGVRNNNEAGKPRCKCLCSSPLWPDQRSQCLEPAVHAGLCTACKGSCACRCWHAGMEEPPAK
jgi:hypothetical protein